MYYSKEEKELVLMAFSIVEELIIMQEAEGESVVYTDTYINKREQVKELLSKFNEIMDSRYESER